MGADGMALRAVPRARKAPARTWREPADTEARLADEAVLRALRLRLVMDSVDVARAMGTYPEWVRMATNRVLADDMATPDRRASADDVEAAYAFFRSRKATRRRA